ncbi:MAG: regulatory protein RecX [Bacteroidetes bacterium]|nr:regulatory protein RecX [Bacteroidota bacterium]
MRVTRIERQERRAGRVNIFVDGRFAAGVSVETLARSGLRTGDRVDERMLESLRNEEDRAAAKSAALRLLGTRPRSVKELRDRLLDKEFADETIRPVLEQLTGAGLLDDDQFARMFVRHQLKLRPAGRIVLRRRLLLRGVDAATADRALDEEMPDPETYALDVARQLLRRARGSSQPGDPALRRRLAAGLARRGFPWAVISGVLRTVLSPTAEHDDEPGSV